MSPAVTMAGAITALVAEKRAVGYKYDAEERVLARFAAFCASRFPELEAPDRASAEAWIAAARQRGVKPATLHGLAAPVRELARWLGRRGVPAYILPAGALPRPARYVPHIYTDQELAALFAQTDRCHYDSQVPFRHLVMPVLFRTIYACGLRASEARLLRFADVDLETGVLTIRNGKGGKDRQVPVSAPLRERLASYHAQIAGRTGGDWFFPGRNGLPLTLMNVNRNFRRFLWQARIPHGGRGHGPRVHDLRHTMAVNNLRYPAPEPCRDLPEGGGQHVPVIGERVRARVARSQQHRQAFARIRTPRRQWVEAVALLPGGSRPLLVELAQVRGKVCKVAPAVPGFVSRVACAGAGPGRRCRRGSGPRRCRACRARWRSAWDRGR